jgi:hypothetical protein
MKITLIKSDLILPIIIPQPNSMKKEELSLQDHHLFKYSLFKKVSKKFKQSKMFLWIFSVVKSLGKILNNFNKFK